MRVAENAALILPLHGELDRAREAAREGSDEGTGKIGTTGRGIGPAYEDKAARRAIRVCDLADEGTLAPKVHELLLHHNALRRGFGVAEVDGAALLADLAALAPKLLPFAEPVWLRLAELRRAGRRILFEGAQGTMLDVDHGTYPFVTSSNTVAAAAATGTGMGPDSVGFVLPFARPVWRDLDAAYRRGRRILFEGAQGVLLDVDHGTYPFVTSSNTIAGTAAGGTGLGPSAAGFVLGIVKAYTTRVGAGPFPTELEDEVGQRLGERGREFGTVTGRKRRCGWFDAVLVRQSCAVAGVTGIALTKLDVLDGLDEIRI